MEEEINKFDKLIVNILNEYKTATVTDELLIKEADKALNFIKNSSKLNLETSFLWHIRQVIIKVIKGNSNLSK